MYSQIFDTRRRRRARTTVLVDGVVVPALLVAGSPRAVLARAARPLALAAGVAAAAVMLLPSTAGAPGGRHAEEPAGAAEPAQAAASGPRFAAAIATASERYRIDADLLRAIARRESGLDPRAVSPRGAQGLMGLMPTTAAALGVTDPFSAEQSIDAGAAYLRQLLNRYDGSLAWALAAYNAGPATVDRARGVPPFGETRAYVAEVMAAAGSR